MKVLYEELEKLPFIDNIPDNKALIGSSFFDENKEYMENYRIDKNDKIIISKSHGLIKGAYWSKK